MTRKLNPNVIQQSSKCARSEEALRDPPVMDMTATQTMDCGQKEYCRNTSKFRSSIKIFTYQQECSSQETVENVLVRNIPPGSGRSISEKVEHFFQTNHRNHYLCHQQVYDGNKFVEHVAERKSLRNCLDYYQLKFERHPEARTTCRTGFLGLFGRRVDSIDFYKQKIEDLETKMIMEHQKVLKDPQAIMPVAFVSFSSRWHAAVCAQTQQSKNPTLWLTEWAPEPRDVYWQNLVIPLASLGIRRLVMAVSVFALVLFYMIPIVLVQSLANLDGLERAAPFLRAVIELKVIKSFLQGFLPGLMLKIFLFFLPTILTIMSKVEGHVSVSKIEREAAAKHYYFMLVNVFLGSIIAGTGFQQLYSFLHQSPIEIPKTIWVSFPMKATFFMTYTMVDGWASIAGETLRLKSLAIFHIKNMFLVKTEKDREQAMDPGTIGITENLPKLQLYFLLGLVYAVVSPVLLPFIIIFFGLAFLVHRHQIINVHDPLYDSVAAFWPHVHGTIIASLMISHFLLLGLLSAKKAASSTPLITILPVLTFGFHKYCKKRFEPAFLKYSLEEAMAADTLVGAVEPDLNLRESLVNAYLHPIVRAVEDLDKGDVRGERAESPASTPISMLSAPSPAFDKGSLYAAGYV